MDLAMTRRFRHCILRLNVTEFCAPTFRTQIRIENLAKPTFQNKIQYVMITFHIFLIHYTSLFMKLLGYKQHDTTIQFHM